MENDCLLCGHRISQSLSFKEIILIKQASKRLICDRCEQKFEKVVSGCQFCSKGGHFKNGICHDCLKWKQNGQLLINKSIYCYNDFFREYMNQYKFRGDYRLRKVFSTELTSKIGSNQIVVPIPVSPETMSKRGFNQVTGLIECDYVEALKTEKKFKQSHKTEQERLLMEQPFQIVKSKGDKIKNKDILLVDDIFTTGTTLHLAAQLVLDAGASSVQSLTLARTV